MRSSDQTRTLMIQKHLSRPRYCWSPYCIVEFSAFPMAMLATTLEFCSCLLSGRIELQVHTEKICAGVETLIKMFCKTMDWRFGESLKVVFLAIDCFKNITARPENALEGGSQRKINTNYIIMKIYILGNLFVAAVRVNKYFLLIFCILAK